MNTSDSVRSLILERIEKQTYKPGDRIDTFRKLAADADTSTPTVSRAINQLVQDGYLFAEPNRGYRVRSTPVGGAVRGTTGLLLGVQQEAEMGQGFAVKRFRDILPVLQEGSIRLRHAMLTLGGFVGPDCLSIDVIAERRLEALLVLGIYDNRYLADLSKVQSGVIVLDMDAVDIGIDSVSFDHIGSGVAMVQHLAGMGKKRIAYIGRPIAPPKPAAMQRNYDSCARERYDGYLAGMRACGLRPDPRLIRLGESQGEKATQDALTEMLAMDEPPDAIVAESPKFIALLINEAGLADRCPVSGWAPDDIYAIEGKMMACTALADFEPLGTAAMDVLAYRLEHPDGPVQRRKVFPKVMGPDGSVLADA